jgi:signal transduction histidine kinase
VSPRQRWGDLFIAAGPLGASFSTEDIQTLEGLACQLALVLDAAELLDRTVAAERSLAQAEKLAAIGELAARVAHEIRNPITAARSLAQQLAREPSGHQEEHEVILMELERVERQIAVLLRFARREEFRFAPVDLGVLAGRTIDDLRPRLEAASIEIGLACEPDLVAPADGEKVRQVLINLVENAMDALGEVPAERRRLRVEAGRRNGTATIQVSDDGPGVSPEALPNLFEPFYSGKPTGTGLGLAIAKRTVDAHGGRISATSTHGAGLTIAIELPLDGAA